MEKLAFIDNSFHKKSTATYFLIEMLKKYFEVYVYWDEYWNNGTRLDLKRLSKKDFEILVIFQSKDYYYSKALNAINYKNIILIPMYDDSHNLPDFLWRWLGYKNIRFICFSKIMHMKFEKLQIESKHIQYFIPPFETVKIKKKFSKLNGFFWQRTNKITWNQISKLVKKANFKKIHIHGAIDPPGHRLVIPSGNEKKQYNITISKWFPHKDDYLKLLAESDVFFASRLFEGIGMAFLEAMAMGKCVVAPDNPTMNEYITHGVNGLLYNPKQPVPLDFSNIREISNNARKYIINGYHQYKETEKEIIDFIRKPAPLTQNRIDRVNPLKIQKYLAVCAIVRKLKNILRFK